jgi:hypothetical protein
LIAVAAQRDTGLLPALGQPVDVGQPPDLLAVGLELRALLRRAQLVGQRGVGGDHEERRAVQGVRPGGEHRDRLVPALDGELHLRAGGAADPVALHGQHALRPAPSSSAMSLSSRSA